MSTCWESKHGRPVCIRCICMYCVYSQLLICGYCLISILVSFLVLCHLVCHVKITWNCICFDILERVLPLCSCFGLQNSFIVIVIIVWYLVMLHTKKSESYSSITVFAKFPQLEDLEHLILWDSTNCLFLLEFGSLGEVAVLFPQGGKSSICIVSCPLTSLELHAVFLRIEINTCLLTITLLKPCV